METLKLPAEMVGRRFKDRISLQAALDREGERLGKLPAAQAMDNCYERAFRLLQSPKTQKALDLAAEPTKVRDRYGWHYFAQSCILARRLVEAGVPMITVYWGRGAPGALGNWDTHSDNFNLLKNNILPPCEQALTALLEDLHNRGLLDETLVIWNGEFGRTPRLNKNAGRDHWGFCQSVLMAGAGVKGGQVYGRSDSSAGHPAENPVSPDDLAATIFDCLGVPLDVELRDPQGRPMPMCCGKPLEAIF